MKRLVTIALLVAILLALPFSVSWSQTHWPTAGANPTQTARLMTLQKMALPADVVEYVRNNFPETTYVVKGMVFNQGSEGTKIKNNVFIDYEREKALVWHASKIDVYEVIKCNNVLWSPSCPTIEATAPTPTPTTAAVPAPATNAEFLSGFPGWFQTLMKILIGLILILFALLIIWLLWRGLAAITDSLRNRTARQTPPTPPTPLAPPAPAPPSEPAPSDLDLLKKLVEEQKAAQERADNLKAQILKEITRMTEAGRERDRQLTEIEKALKS